MCALVRNDRKFGVSATNTNLTFRPLRSLYQKNRPAPLGGYERLYQLSKAVYSVLNRLMEALYRSGSPLCRSIWAWSQ